MVARTAPASDIEDVTPADSDVSLEVATPAVVVGDESLTSDWRPAADEVFPMQDTSLRAILGRSYQNAERGLIEYDPVTKTHVRWKPNGRGGHLPEVRPVADDPRGDKDERERIIATGKDYWHIGRNCWIWGGVKPSSDPASASSEPLE